MLYISQSQELIQLLSLLNLELLYDPVLNVGKESAFIDPNISNGKRFAEVQQLKVAYCMGEQKESADEGKALLEGIKETRIGPRELVIYPFGDRYASPNEDMKKMLSSWGSENSASNNPSDEMSKEKYYTENRTCCLFIYSEIY